VRTRLVGTYLMFIALVLVGLAAPLAVTVAAGRSEEMVQDRLVDAAALASLADPALQTGQMRTLDNDLGRYYDLYGILAAVVDRDGTVVLWSGDTAARFSDPSVKAPLEKALAGIADAGDRTIWPWRSSPLTVAMPVRSAGETIGAVVTVSPTAAVRREILLAWASVAAGVLAAGAVFVVVALALVRWILRPIADLDDAAHRMGSSDAQADAALTAAGPPELRRLTRSFNDMAERVTDLLRRQRDFVAQASHQMRNPLTALMLRVEELGQHIEQPTGRTDHRLAIEETRRLARILDVLLALAQAEQPQPELEVVDAAAIAEERMIAWLPLATSRGIALTCARPDGALVVALATAVGQSLDALMDNALKFCGAGAVVRVEVRGGDEVVDIHVIDDGPGITDEGRHRASEPFWRAPEVQSLDGCGLGLPIAKALMEASGGRLDLMPCSVRGVDARLRFPAASPAAALGYRLASR
jgi:signal transduction histidine kinase